MAPRRDRPLLPALLFLCTLLAACVTVASLPEAPGRDLYAAKCHSCHRLRRPSSHGRGEWAKILDRMAPRAKLTLEEEAEIRRYLYETSSKD
jgi:mono/diheme cytochrome c family protein